MLVFCYLQPWLGGIETIIELVLYEAQPQRRWLEFETSHVQYILQEGQLSAVSMHQILSCLD
jgi:hypothetical protein